MAAVIDGPLVTGGVPLAHRKEKPTTNAREFDVKSRVRAQIVPRAADARRRAAFERALVLGQFVIHATIRHAAMRNTPRLQCGNSRGRPTDFSREFGVSRSVTLACNTTSALSTGIACDSPDGL